MATEQTIANLIVKLSVQAVELTAGLKQAENSVSSVVGRIKTAMAGLASVFAVNELKNLVMGSVDFADSLGKMSQKVGIAVPVLHALSLEAKKNEMDLDGLNTGLRRLAQNASDAAAGGVEARDKFRALGIDVIDPLTKKLKPMDQLLLEVSGKFASWSDSTQKTAWAMDLFGRSGSKMIPILNSIGVDGFDPLLEKAKEFGGVLSAEDAKAAEEFQHLTIDLGKGLSSLAMGFTQALLPSLKSSAEAMATLSQYITGAKEAMKEWVPILIDAGKAIGAMVAFGGIAAWIAGFGGLAEAVTFAGFAIKYFALTTLPALFNPLTAVAAAIGAVVYLWSSESRALQESETRVDKYSASLKNLTQAQLDNYQQQLKLYMLELARKEEALREQLPSGEAATGGFQPEVQGSVFDAGIGKRLETILRFKDEATKLLSAVGVQMDAVSKPKSDAPMAFKGTSDAIDKVRLKTQELITEMTKINSPVEAGRLAIEKFIKETVKEIPLEQYPKLRDAIGELRAAYEKLAGSQEAFAQKQADVVKEAAKGDEQLAGIGLAMQKLTYAYEDGQTSVADYFASTRNAIGATSEAQLANIEQQRSLLKNEGDDLKKRAELDREAAKIKADTTAKNVEETRKEELALRNLVIAYSDARAKIAMLQEKATPGGTDAKVQARYDAELAALEANHVKELESYQRMTDAQLEAATGFSDRVMALDSIRAQQRDERAVLENEQSMKRFDDLMAEATAYGNVQMAIETLMGAEGQRAAVLQEQQSYIQLYKQAWMDANLAVANSMQSLYSGMTNWISSSLQGLIEGTMRAQDVLKNLGKMMLGVIAEYVAKWVVSRLVMLGMEMLFAAGMVKIATGAAAAVATAWAPAAFAASVATLGGAVVEGSAALAIGLAAAVALFAGMQGTLGGGMSDAVNGGTGAMFAGGGPVTSGSGTKDDVPALLTRGEYVQPAPTVRYYGTDIMEAIRRRIIPRDILKGFGFFPVARPQFAFASGGEVSGGGAASDRGSATSRQSDREVVNDMTVNVFMDGERIGNVVKQRVRDGRLNLKLV